MNPINNYGVALNIAPYEVISETYTSITGDEFEFTYWVLPENKEKGLAVFPEFKRQMDFFEKFCGPYPFRRDKYGVAETPSLGMEHQTMSGQGTFNIAVTAHELGHQWFGDLITCAEWNDIWRGQSGLVRRLGLRLMFRQ